MARREAPEQMIVDGTAYYLTVGPPELGHQSRDHKYIVT